MRRPGEVAYTTVDAVRDFVVKTGVDFVAVSVGAPDGRKTDEPEPDHRHLEQIEEALGIPLAVRRGADLSVDQIGCLIANGVAKVDFGR